MAPGSVFLQLSVARGLLKCALVKEDSSVSPDVSAAARITREMTLGFSGYQLHLNLCGHFTTLNKGR